MAKYFRVINVTESPITKTWTSALLDDADLQDYNEWKRTEEFVGFNEKEITARKRIAEAIKARPFYERLAKDVRVPVPDRKQEGKEVFTQTRYEWRWAIGPNTLDLLKESEIDPETLEDDIARDQLTRRLRQRLSKARGICEEHHIRINKDDSIKDVVAAIVNYFGPNFKVMNERQWIESGLNNGEVKELVVRPRAGFAGEQATIKSVGHFVAEEMTEMEVEEYFNPPVKSESKSKNKKD